MSFFVTAIVLILLAVFFVFIGVGVILVLGIVLVLAGVAAILAMIFGDGNSFSFIHKLNKGSEIPAKFNVCLMQESPEVCREKWTTWDETKIELVKQLAQQAQQDLGLRENSSTSTYRSESINGVSTVKLALVSDFEKKKKVHESYVLVEKNDELKIDELKWDY